MSTIALVGIATSLIALSYLFSGWAPRWLAHASWLHMNGAGHVRTQKIDPEAHYLGSIIVSPERGDKCRELGLDNRNGAIWDKGYVNCDVVPPLSALQNDAKGLAARRLKAIGKAFAFGRQ
jgi:hypothetical protein